jgi:hypothetical protein
MIVADTALNADDVVKVLVAGLTPLDGFFPKTLINKALNASPKNKKGKPKWEGKLRLPCAAVRAHLKNVREIAGASDVALMWGHEFATKEYENIECVEPTPFDFTAGNQGFLAMVSDLCDKTDKIDFQQALFGPWKYADKEPSLRWDPLDDRRYALRWTDPTQDDIRTVWGANRLAIEGLAFYPNILTARGKRLPGLTERDRVRTWRWPLWDRPASPAVVRTLISTAASAKPGDLDEMGVVATFESQIVQPTGYYRNFTPAMPVWIAGRAL